MKNSSNQSSDSDDWTLISPPHSSSSSPDREQLLNNSIELNRFEPQEQPVQTENDDNLMEIDLRSSTIQNLNDTNDISESSTCASSIEPGFQPLDTTSDDSDQQDSRRPSLTQSELGEYVDLSKGGLENINKADDNDDRTISVKENPHVLEEEGSGITSDNDPKEHNEEDTVSELTKPRLSGRARLTSFKAMLDDLDRCAQASNRRLPPKFMKLDESTGAQASLLARVLNNDLAVCLICMFAWLSVMIIVLISADVPVPTRSGGDLPSALNCDLRSKFSFGDSIPTSQQYVELKLLHSELSQCIKRQSPTSFKYYMSEDRFKDYDQSTSKPYPAGNGMNQKPYRGLVCYGQEYQWRERFDRLKADYDLDLRKLMHEAKKTVTNEMLEFHHPTLQFKLILNQIEYLDFLENKRNKKQSEETIKYLKAENLQLLRRLNQPNDTGYQKVVVNLELQNAKLQRENEALKANLIGKAGPTYIRQSLELEQFERENLMLKQFHHQVAQDVSKSLKQFNLHIIDASTILDDHESLKTQLLLTRGYLRRLSEKIATVLLENESLKEELKEAYLFGTVNKANLPAPHSGIFDSEVESSNNSNALIADNCMRNLIDAKERSNRLEEELDKLKRNCQRNVDLEKSSGRHLNKTGGDNGSCNDGFSKRDWKQLSSSAETAIDKRLRDTVMSQADDDDDGNVVDDLIVYLSNFLDNQVESWSNDNGLATLEHQDSTGFSSSPSSHDNADAKIPPTDDSAKIIPEYIREAVRPLTKKAQSHISEAMNSIVGLLNTPLYMHLTGDSNSAELPDMPNNSPACGSTGDQSSDQSDLDSPSEVPGEVSPEVESERNFTNVEEAVENVGRVDPVTMNFSPGWLFKRAKQRKELRREPQVEPQSNWMLMRATVRDTLRKAATYIDQHYIEGAREIDNNNWQSKSFEQPQKRDGKQRKKEVKRDYSKSKRSHRRNRSPNPHQERPIQRGREEL